MDLAEAGLRSTTLIDDGRPDRVGRAHGEEGFLVEIMTAVYGAPTLFPARPGVPAVVSRMTADATRRLRGDVCPQQWTGRLPMISVAGIRPFMGGVLAAAEKQDMSGTTVRGFVHTPSGSTTLELTG